MCKCKAFDVFFLRAIFWSFLMILNEVTAWFLIVPNWSLWLAFQYYHLTAWGLWDDFFFPGTKILDELKKWCFILNKNDFKIDKCADEYICMYEIRWSLKQIAWNMFNMLIISQSSIQERHLTLTLILWQNLN